MDDTLEGWERLKVPTAAIYDRTLSKLAVRVLMAIDAHRCTRQGHRWYGLAWASQTHYADLLLGDGSKRPKINAAIHELKNRGYLTIVGKHPSGSLFLKLAPGACPPIGDTTCPPIGDTPPDPHRGTPPVPSMGTQPPERTLYPPNPPTGNQCGVAADRGDKSIAEGSVGAVAANGSTPQPASVPDAWREAWGKNFSNGSHSLGPVYLDRIGALPKPEEFWRYADRHVERVGAGQTAALITALQFFKIPSADLPTALNPPTGRRKRKADA